VGVRRITRAGVRRRISRVRSRAAEVLAGGRPTGQTSTPHGAEFAAWVERRQNRGAGFPEWWRALAGVPFAEPSCVCVLVHVYYPELLEELVGATAAIPVDFDLIVTNASGKDISESINRLDGPKNRVVLTVENHGRDIWPMIQVVNAGLLDPYELVLKLHTKRSEWRQEHPDYGDSGSQWREQLLGGLLGADENVKQILGAFAEDPNLGVVAGPANLLGPDHWGADIPLSQELLHRLELRVTPATLRFPAGSVYWARGFVLQGLRALMMSADDFEPEPIAIDGTTAHAVERVIGLLAGEAGYSLCSRDWLPPAEPESWQRFMPTAPRMPRARFIAFYLPQFHPFRENDTWWGPGFTEWSNVTAARPIYRGQNQPNLPADLGFYDLRLPEVREAQAALAAAHGIEGFMYYYYWFAGTKLMSRPIESHVDSDLKAPFCIMWANENWTRRWDGRASDVLIAQDYGRVPAEQFIDDVLPLLLDSRYLRIGDKAVLATYRVGQIPDFPAVAEHWRSRAREAGVGELCLLGVDVAPEFDGIKGQPSDQGLDGALWFPPHNLLWDWVPHTGLHVDRRWAGNLLSYERMVTDAERRLIALSHDKHPGVMVTFDNTARRQWASDVWYGANPYTFRRWLAASVSAVVDREPEERIVFLNAWNEWAESAVLEPTRRFGRTYLAAVRDVARG